MLHGAPRVASLRDKVKLPPPQGHPLKHSMKEDNMQDITHSQNGFAGKRERTPHSRVRQDNPSPNSGLWVRQFRGFGKIPLLNGSRFGKRT